MTSEDDFQATLDANPEDWQTRLVFADWLQEQGDPRAEGYRALGACRVWPHIFFDRWSKVMCCYHSGMGRTNGYLDTIAAEHRLPSQRWLDLTQDEEHAELALMEGRSAPRERSHNTVLSSCIAPSRQFLEDAAARAFTKLAPAEQTAMLAGGRL